MKLKIMQLLKNNKHFQNQSYDGTSFPPTGWTQLQVIGKALWDRVTQGQHPVCFSHSSPGIARYNCYKFGSGTQVLLITPVFTLATGQGKLGFWFYRDNNYLGRHDSIGLWINTAPYMGRATWLGLINRNRSLPPVENQDGWYNYEFTIPSSFNTSTNYIYFRTYSDYGNDIDLDNVYISFLNPITPISNIKPNKFNLSQYFPDPFNPSINIKFDIPKSSLVQLAIYDLLGKEITKLVYS